MDEKKITKEVEIDFSPLLEEHKRFAVHCRTEADAEHFLKCLRKEYPDKCRGWTAGETHWGRYERMCYRPNLNLPDEYTLKYCSYEHYEDDGFVIIPYEDLLIVDIEESEQQIDLLLS